ncbi:MAG: YcnI family protein [Solirubrobacteraceae bacterium]
MRRRTILIAGLAAVLVAAPAQAHVTLQPGEVPAGSFARVDVRVPNERDDAGTTKVVVRMPDAFASVSYEPQPGWTVRVAMEEAPEPIELHGEEVTEQVDTVTFSGGVINPGEFQDFGLSVRIPEGEPGETLTFPALQTYEGGEVVRWIGPEDSDEPAPTVTLAATPDEPVSSGGSVGAQEPATDEVETAPAAATTDGGGDDGSGLAIVALIVGGLGLAAGLAGLLAARRARSEQGSGGRVVPQP